MSTQHSPPFCVRRLQHLHATHYQVEDSAQRFFVAFTSSDSDANRSGASRAADALNSHASLLAENARLREALQRIASGGCRCDAPGGSICRGAYANKTFWCSQCVASAALSSEKEAGRG